jgi:DNA-binding MarR family transcriptional regulator
MRVFEPSFYFFHRVVLPFGFCSGILSSVIHQLWINAMSPKDKLTKKQSQVLDFVTEYIRDNGYAPSYREIGEALGVSSTATVHEHVKNLEQKGYLSGEEDRS